MAYTASIRRKHNIAQGGETLIEVLIAMLIFSLGLAGLAQLQISALSRQREVNDAAFAVQMASDLAEQIRSFPELKDSGLSLSKSTGNPRCGPGSRCDASAMLNAGFQHWLQRLQLRIPDADALVCNDATPQDGDVNSGGCDAGGAPVIKLWWPDRERNMRRYVLQVQQS